MSRIVTDQEAQAVSVLSPASRYSYFVKFVCDTEEVWSLAEADGWLLGSDNQGREVIPVWPHSIYVSPCLTGAWSKATPRSIPLAEWMESWLPGLQKDGRLVGVFPTSADKAVILEPEQLKQDLEIELENYA